MAMTIFTQTSLSAVKNFIAMLKKFLMKVLKNMATAAMLKACINLNRGKFL
jgi:hypothetical protein